MQGLGLLGFITRKSNDCLEPSPAGRVDVAQAYRLFQSNLVKIISKEL